MVDANPWRLGWAVSTEHSEQQRNGAEHGSKMVQPRRCSNLFSPVPFPPTVQMLHPFDPSLTSRFPSSVAPSCKSTGG